SIYNVEKINKYGIIKMRGIISIYKYLLLSFSIGLIILMFLSKVIFNVEVLHEDNKVRTFLLNELDSYGIKKYNLKKNYNRLQDIKKQILDKYQDKIEWLEIIEQGTKYIIKVEVRIIPYEEKEKPKQNIVATKSAIIKKIIATKGEIVKETDSYVKTGDIIISGNIKLNDYIKKTDTAQGIVYGEVWYNVTVSYPYMYSQIKKTGKEKDVYGLKFLNKTLELNFNKFKEKTYEEKPILKNFLLPISLVKQKQKEIKTISEVLTVEEASLKAISHSKEKILDKLKMDEHIIEYQVLKTNVKEDKVVLDIFYTVYENITGYMNIEGVDHVS
ncbi:MAG: sporulation protein YqfD, partial [Bacilli bacterium]